MSEKILDLSSSLESLSGVGPAKYKLLQESGLSSVSELLDYWPKRYVDYSKVTNIKDIKPGLVTLKISITSIKGRWARGRAMHLTKAVVEDDNGDRMPVVWFNQPFRLTSFKTDQQYFLSGEFKASGGRLNLTNPTVEPVKDSGGQDSTARIIPIYPERSNLNSKLIRSLIIQIEPAVRGVKETLPGGVLDRYKLILKSEAIWQLHMPESMQSLNLAKRRLAFEEILTLQLAVEKNKQFIQKLTSPKIEFKLEETRKIISSLKFKLTDDQRRVSWRILQDMDKSEPMNRMLMGDVGSGKTVVAALAALQAIKAGKQVVVLAPTEVLARQHYKSFSELLKPSEAKVELLVGSIKPKDKKDLYEQIERGEAELIVGTHALLQEKVKFKDLALVIVDEQHRFGVNQRKELQKRVGGTEKSNQFPHLLTMTATPIPRSLALILYGELEQSVIKTKPPGRIEIKTELIPGASKQKVWDKMKEELEADHAVIIVCPAITDSEASKRISAEKIFTQVSKKAISRKYGVALLHGKLKADEKERIMSDFISGKINILVSTTVIEVGIDIPRATLIVIEGAEYFGLAQLHQLRGRVGRSDLPSYCYLVPAKNDGIPARLRYFADNTDGFKLAQYDLEMRGPGQVYGKLQSGALDLRLVDITDLDLIKQAREAAKKIIEKNIALSAELKNNIQKHQDLEYLN